MVEGAAVALTGVDLGSGHHEDITVTRTPQTLPPSALRSRNRRIAADRASGLTWPVIAERHGLSVRQARRAAAAARAISVEERGPEVAEKLDPLAILTQITRSQLRALDSLAELAAEADNDAARVGACRALGSIGSDLRSSLHALGLLPDPNDELLRVRVQEVVRAIANVTRRLDIPPAELQREVEREPALQTRSNGVPA